MPSSAPADKAEPYRSGFWQRLFDLLFGYDYFIAHRSADGKRYAAALYEELTAPGSELDCFLDVKHYDAGGRLPWMQSRALRKTARLIVVVTPHAHDPEAEYLRGEITQFRKQHRDGVIVPIGTAKTLLCENQPSSKLLAQIPRLPEDICILEEEEALLHGKPSAATVEKLRNDFKEQRQRSRRLRALKAFAACMAVLAIAAMFFGWRSQMESRQRQRLLLTARSELLALRARGEVLRAPARAMTMAAQAYSLQTNRVAWAAWLEAVYGSPEGYTILHEARPVLATDSHGSWVLTKGTDGGLISVSRAGLQKAFPDAERFRGLGEEQNVILTSLAETNRAWRLKAGDALLTHPAAAGRPFVTMSSEREIEEETFTPYPQGGDVTIVTESRLPLLIRSQTGAEHRTQLRLKLNVTPVPEIAPVPGVFLLRRDDLRARYSIGWISATNLLSEPAASTREPLWFDIEQPRQAVATADASMWWIDRRGQVRRWQPGSSPHQVSDATFGAVNSFAPSADGAWIAASHVGGLLRMQAVGAPRHGILPTPEIIRWAGYWRRDGLERFIAVFGERTFWLAEWVGEAGWQRLVKLRPSLAPGAFHDLIAVPEKAQVPVLLSYSFPSLGRIDLRNGAITNHANAYVTSRLPVFAATISADGNLVAWSTEVDAFVCGAEGKRRRPISRNSGQNRIYPIRHLAFATIDGRAVWAGSSEMLGRWNVARSEFEWVQKRTVGLIAPDLQRDRICVEDGNGGLVIIDRHGAADDFAGLGSPAKAMAFHSDQPLLLVGDSGGTLSLWDTERRTELAQIPLSSAITHVGFARGGSFWWVATEQALFVWDVRPETLKARTTIAGE